MNLTAPGDFLDLDRLDDDGCPNRIEENWDEPPVRKPGRCEVCEASIPLDECLCKGCFLEFWKTVVIA